MSVYQKALALSFVLWAGLASLSEVNAADTKKPLSLGFMPYLNAELLVEKYTPLASYLSTKLGRDVNIQVAKNYGDHIAATGEDQLDISFLGGSPYVVIAEKYGVKPLLARYEFDGKPTFRAVIFVYKDSPLKDLAALKGKTMAFGSAKSTLSTQVPLYMLMQAGAGLDQLASYKHLRNHSNVVLGVEIGDFDAGAVAEEVFNEHKANPVRVLAYSPDLSTHVFVTRANMEANLKTKIAKALQDLKTEPEGKEILAAIGPTLTGFVPVQDSDYDLHRTILKEVLPVLEP
ncbi:phosphate/phosphite/phosphonate ABC transporter substrate-binding protein [Magnetovibrio sp. PR-2]|uniref:phosphate/phosphite/phosphonate ABC transporter substrate-binding protein n=1 Tax=Magnetovibrio sp. PR-2 TaxID=3120356 RepID=UPI002FCE5AA3